MMIAFVATMTTNGCGKIESLAVELENTTWNCTFTDVPVDDYNTVSGSYEIFFGAEKCHIKGRDVYNTAVNNVNPVDLNADGDYSYSWPDATIKLPYLTVTDNALLVSEGLISLHLEDAKTMTTNLFGSTITFRKE